MIIYIIDYDTAASCYLTENYNVCHTCNKYICFSKLDYNQRPLNIICRHQNLSKTCRKIMYILPDLVRKMKHFYA